MFAVYASEGNLENPLASLVVGERPEPIVPEGWVRVKVSHASLNRHDIFTLMGVTAQAAFIVFPMILGNDGAGTLDDGSEVVIYPLMGSPDWRGDETLDPYWNIFSERVPGTFAKSAFMSWLRAELTERLFLPANTNSSRFIWPLSHEISHY